jgi:ATP-dependent DNA helicase RecQ
LIFSVKIGKVQKCSYNLLRSHAGAETASPDEPMSKPTLSPQNAFRQYWGHESFLPLQEEAIDCVLKRQDSLLVLPTGGGKSACYQLPALVLQGLALVVSPLIALMKDQVDSLRLNGIPAACINSTLTMAEKRQVAEELRAGKLNLIYISPEKLVQERTLAFFQTLNLQYIAIDEAHCISQWGHDFRPEYRQLGDLRRHFPQASLHAYTATATTTVQQDIVTQLKLENPRLLIGSFARPNLTYRVFRKTGHHFQQILEVLDRHPGESGIIYCQSRKEVEKLSRQLRETGREVWPYHAGMEDDERRANQEAFINHESGIMVATIAFGMGVDKPNIRFVIHSGLPKALENYQQESGRAGRDGLPAECLLFYNQSDHQRWLRHLNEAGPEEGGEGARHSLAAMVAYAHGTECRHRFLVAYFGQQLEKENCGSCDICKQEMTDTENPAEIARTIVSNIIHQRENFGLHYSAEVLKGSRNQRIRANLHDRLPTWGALKEQSLEQIKFWIEQLIDQEFLERCGEYQVIKVGTRGPALLNRKLVPRLLNLKKSRPPRPAPGTKTSETLPLTAEEQELFEDLRQLRRELARERGVPPYLIFSDKTLCELAHSRPIELESFHAVKGVGEQKLQDFGKIFTARIRAFNEKQAADSRPEHPFPDKIPEGP